MGFVLVADLNNGGNLELNKMKLTLMKLPGLLVPWRMATSVCFCICCYFAGAFVYALDCS